MGELVTISQILSVGSACVYTQCHYTTRPICTSEGLKRAIPCKDVPFEGLNDVPLNFGSHSQKKLIFWAR